jgi:hypothetical protein
MIFTPGVDDVRSGLDHAVGRGKKDHSALSGRMSRRRSDCRRDVVVALKIKQPPIAALPTAYREVLLCVRKTLLPWAANHGKGAAPACAVRRLKGDSDKEPGPRSAGARFPRAAGVCRHRSPVVAFHYGMGADQRASA